jgi:hypothetical protein
MKITLLSKYLPFLLAFLFFSCHMMEKKPFREAVLEHYSATPEDSLKLKAASFLLHNMQGLETLDPASVSQNQPFFSYMEMTASKYDVENHGQGKRKIPDDVFAKGMDSMVAIYSANVNALTEPAPRFRTDTAIITPEFLINNIDQAFSTWKSAPWARQLSFPDFCEYILPYRIGDSWWDKSRSYFRDRYKHLADSLKKEENRITVGETIRQDIHLWYKEDGTFSTTYPFMKPMPFERILKGGWGDCYEATLIRVTAMRMLGVPVAFEMIPRWGNVNSQTHFFYKIIDPVHDTITSKIDNANVYRDTRYIVDGSSYVEKLEKVPGNINITYNKSIPKIFRLCFSMQDSSLGHRRLPDGSVPPFFKSDRLNDVTANYIETANVTIDLSPTNNKFAFLCVFHPNGWEPVAWTEVTGNKAVFRNMGKNIVYLPAFYINNKLEPAGPAFLLKLDGTIQPLIPSPSKQKMSLTRKFRISSHNVGNAMQCVGARFQVANDSGLRDTINLHTIRDVKLSMTGVSVNNPQKFRYVLFRFDSAHKSSVAEMEVWGIKDGRQIKLQGLPIGNPGEYKNNIKNAFDADKLTYFMYNPEKENYIGLDLGAAYTITEIRYCPRNDDNNIAEGNVYELFYWDNQWISIGEQTGKELDPLMYSGPANALFWLRNKTKGVEERIFTYRNDQQVFW